MGLFTRKKKSPTLSASPRLPSCPTTPVLEQPPAPAIRPTIRLRVAVDPLPAEGSTCFCIEVDLEDDVSALRRMIQRRIGNMAIGLYKASIPIQALEHSREYASRYGFRPDLLGLFPTFSLDDPSQLAPSFGGAAWQSTTHQPLIQDWFPSSIDYRSVISILVRPCVAPAHVVPLTLIAHFAPVDGRKPSAVSSPALGVAGPSRLPPRVVTIAPTASVEELKVAILTADGRRVARLERIILWKVEMSENEMVVIQERGGLKNGQMPWPYPPTAEVPTKLENATVGTYWQHCNPRMVSVSVWLSPTAHIQTAVARPDIPTFTYPMNFPTIVRRASTSNSLPERSPPAPPSPPRIVVSTAPVEDTLTVAPRGRRCRPSTAPALSEARPFGAKFRTPLSPPPMHEDPAVGLGIGSEIAADMSKLQLQYEIGQELQQDGKVVWYNSSRRSTVKRSASTIRTFTDVKALRANEVA